MKNVHIFTEMDSLQIEDKSIVLAIKKAWTSGGNKVADIKDVSIYIKSEDRKAYFVMNDNVIKGSVDLTAKDLVDGVKFGI